MRKNLWDAFISSENFAAALRNAIRGKKTKPAIARFLENAAENLESIRQSVMRGEFKTSEYRTMEITDPKPRTIYILPFAPDRIVHHAIMNILASRWTRRFIRDTYACIPGRGLHAASRRAMQFCRRNKYVLKCDVRKFYPSIDHNIMFEIIKKYVPDQKLRDLLRDIIYSVNGGKNMPIGNLCSQWMGNLYLNELDNFAKYELGVRDYLRYSDDFCLFSDDKKQLGEWRAKIGEFLTARLGLCFSKSEIFPVADGLDFVGYRHFKDFVMLRKRTARRIRDRMRKIGEITDETRGQIASARGWLKHACSYNFRKSIGMDKLLAMRQLCFSTVVLT
ncbi:MAG: RNA-directed DNA polymerase [Rickettsiales bacterium]|jgi:hypothetical protein|nr:RNA-directed DNA polymerase [Rickettsiales bacterium]